MALFIGTDAGSLSAGFGLGSDTILGFGGVTGLGANSPAQFSSFTNPIVPPLVPLASTTQPANLIGSSADDVLIGDDNANSLAGGSGDDRLAGLGGSDLLVGGSGHDTFIFERLSDGVDIIADFEPGADLILLSRPGLQVLSPVQTATLAADGDPVTLSDTILSVDGLPLARFTGATPNEGDILFG